MSEQQNEPVEQHLMTTEEVTLIVQLQIRDYLAALLRHFDAHTARDLLEFHYSGNILAAEPWFNGQFITNMLNEDGESVPAPDLPPIDTSNHFREDTDEL